MFSLICKLSLHVALLSICVCSAQVPDAPSKTKEDAEAAAAKNRWHVIEKRMPPSHPGFFTLRRAGDPPLRTNRQTLSSPAFLLPVALAWGAAYADVRINRHGANVPQGNELYVDAYVPAAAVTVLSYTMDRFVSRSIGAGLLGYLTFVHVRGAVTRNYP